MANKAYTVAVNVVGDASGATKTFDAVAGKAEQAGGRMGKAFSGVLGELNKTGVLGPFSEAIAHATEGVGKLAEAHKNVGQAAMAVGGATLSVGMLSQSIGSKDKEAQQQLKASIEATGKSYEDYGGQIEKAIKSGEHYGHNAVETQRALQTLTDAMGGPEKALAAIGDASGLAAKKHWELNTAATQLGKTFNGGTKLLKDFHIEAGPKLKTALHDAEMATKAVTAEEDASAKAKQNLIDLEERLGARHVASAVSTTGVTSATQALDKAQQHLQQLEAIDNASGKPLTIAQNFALSNAKQAVSVASERVAAAEGKVGGAQVAAAGKAGLSVSQQQQLRKAHDAVTLTSDKLTDSQKKLAGAHDEVTKAGGTQTNTMDQLHQHLKGQDDAMANSFTGHLRAFKAEIEDTAAKLGAKYGPAITALGAGMTAGGAIWEGAAGIIGKFGSKAKEAGEIADKAGKLTKAGGDAAKLAAAGTTALTTATEGEAVAMDGAAVSEGLALAPILLIVAAIAILAVGIYELATRWKAVWQGVQDVVGGAIDFVKNLIGSVVDWIKKHWELLLAILTGPFGLAVLFITDHFSEIVKFVGEIPGKIAAFAGHMWDSILDSAKRLGGDVIDFFAGIPGKIISFFGNLGGDILHAITSMIPGGGIIGSAIHAVGGLFKAAGGPVGAGEVHIVGEKGPELFVANTAGMIVPNGAFTMASSMARGSVTTGAMAQPAPGGAGSYTGGSAGGGHGHDIYLDGRLVGRTLTPHMRDGLSRASFNTTDLIRS